MKNLLKKVLNDQTVDGLIVGYILPDTDTDRIIQENRGFFDGLTKEQALELEDIITFTATKASLNAFKLGFNTALETMSAKELFVI